MIETIHLSFGNLIIGALFFIIPLYALYAFKVEIWGRTLKALATMAVALTLGALLTVLAARADHIGVTLLCALLAATAWYMRIKARIRQANYIVPIMLGLTLTILPLSLIFVYLVLGMNPLAPHLLLPIVAITTGAVAESNVKAMGAYYDGLHHHARLYYYLTANGATHREATNYLARRSMKRSLIPLLQRMGIMGMGTAPVMMWAMTMSGTDIMSALVIQLLFTGLLISAAPQASWRSPSCWRADTLLTHTTKSTPEDEEDILPTDSAAVTVWMQSAQRPQATDRTADGRRATATDRG